MIALAGIVFLLAMACVISSSRAAIRWKTVFWGLCLQLAFALLVLRGEMGSSVWRAGAGVAKSIVAVADEGSGFLFGWLASTPEPGQFVFAFKVLPIVIVFSSLSACLYHLGAMQLLVRVMAKVIRRTMGVSGAESLAAAGNVFVGQAEAPLLVAPYIPVMTRSELMALMTGGMATISGSVLGGYISMGIDPEHLIAASFLSAPAALVMAKMIVPELESSRRSSEIVITPSRTAANLVDAAARGARQGARVALNIGAMLIAFVALAHLANAALVSAGRVFGLEDLLGTALTLEVILGALMAPVAYLMGVPWPDSFAVGELIGVKIVFNEFVAYAELAKLQGALAPKSEMIATYALCGFANIGSVGVQVGGIGILAPNRRKDLAGLGLKSLLAGVMASLLTAALAGLVVRG